MPKTYKDWEKEFDKNFPMFSDDNLYEYGEPTIVDEKFNAIITGDEEIRKSLEEDIREMFFKNSFFCWSVKEKIRPS